MSDTRLSLPACVSAGKSGHTDADIPPRPMPQRASSDSFTSLVRQAADTDAGLGSGRHQALVQSLSHMLVDSGQPPGTIDAGRALQLQQALAPEGVISAALALEVLHGVIALARDVPDLLIVLALDQLRLALAHGIGAYQRSRRIIRPGVTRYDLEYIERILAHAQKPAQRGWSPEIMAVLNTIDYLAEPSQNHPAWHDFLTAAYLDEPARPSEPRRRWLWVDGDPAPIDQIAAKINHNP